MSPAGRWELHNDAVPTVSSGAGSWRDGVQFARLRAGIVGNRNGKRDAWSSMSGTQQFG